MVSGAVVDEPHAKYTKTHAGPRFVRVTGNYPVTWAIEGLEPKLASDAAPVRVEDASPDESKPTPTPVEEPPSASVEAPAVIANGEPDKAVQPVASDPSRDATVCDPTPALPYILRPGPYSPVKPTKAVAVLVKEAILAGIPDKALSQADIISYIRTTYPFYASSHDLESEVAGLLQQHFAPKEDGTALVDGCWDDIQDPSTACSGHTSRLLREERHGERLVEQPQLSALALLVVGVAEDAAVQQCAVYVCDHGADVTRRVWLAVRGVLDAVEVLDDRLVEVHRVTLVEGVYFPSWRDLDLQSAKSEYISTACSLQLNNHMRTYVWMCEDELAE